MGLAVWVAVLCACGATLAGDVQNASECCPGSGGGSGYGARARGTLIPLQDEDRINRFAARRMLHYMPAFDRKTAQGVGEVCRAQLDLYLADLTALKLWALKLYDSTAKMSSGLLNGNVNQLGDFDQCLSVSHRPAASAAPAAPSAPVVRGKYCLAAVQLSMRANASRALADIHRLVHSNYAFRSDLDDPGHRVPKFSTINWAFCVPDGCSHDDVAAVLGQYLSVMFEGTSVEIGVRVQPEQCQVKRSDPPPLGTIITGLILAAVVLVVVGATVYDWYIEDKKNKYAMSFSLKHNFEKIIASRSSDDIACVHGIRFINSVMLIISHKSMAIIFIPFFNRTDMSNDIGKPWTAMSRAASLYTDPFIMFSGLLTTYSILRRLNRHGRISLPKEYISRLVRIIPPFGVLILFCTWIMPLMSTGPYWNQVVTTHSGICKKYWWRNLLFIHNYFGFEDMCLTHTHHIGIDTQLFLLTPPLVLLLWRWPRRSGQALLAAAALSTAARYYVTYTMKLSNYVFFGTSVKQLFETADYMYILPAHRATVYIMGILLGYLLHTSKNMVLSKAQLRVGWAGSTVLLLVSFLGPAGMSTIDYVYDATQAAWYAAFAPIAWCAFFGWVIYTSHLGYTNWITRFFSWRGYALWTKISYSVYLTQFPIFFYSVGITRTPQEYSFSQLVNFKELVSIVILSVALTLLVELPCQNLKDIVLCNYTNYSKQKLLQKQITEKIAQYSIKDEQPNNAVQIVEKYRHVEEDKMK